MRVRLLFGTLLAAVVLVSAACGSSEKSQQSVVFPSSTTTASVAPPKDRPPACVQSDQFGIIILGAEQKAATATPEEKASLTAALDTTSAALKASVPSIEKDVATRADLRKKLISGQTLTPDDYQADKNAAEAISKWYATLC